MSDNTRVKTYPVPGGEAASDDYSISVNGNPVSAYKARVSAVPFNQVWPGYQRPLDQTELASFAYWDMSGPVIVEVTSRRPVKSVVIRPGSYQIQPSVKGDKIVFQMPRFGQVTVEVNGTHHALHLFANPMEENAPNPEDPHVLYFGPGVHRPGKISLKDGQTLYISGGAVVHSAIEARESSNIRILGRGILDVSTFERGDAAGAISLYGCTNVEIDGIVIRDPNVWTVIPAGCQHIAISDIKLIGLWRYNADGIDVVNSQHITIDRCFIRSFDDSIALKGLKGRASHPTGDKPIQDVIVRDCVIWNDWGRALEMGAETVAPEMSDIVFSNCDIIRTVHIAMDIQHGDRAAIRNVRFENIRFEIDDYTPRPQFQTDRSEKYRVDENDDYCPNLLVLEIRENNYSKDKERGRMENVQVKDVVVTGNHFPGSYLRGYDATHRVENVSIENLRVNGQLITSAREGRFAIGDHVSNVRFVADHRES